MGAEGSRIQGVNPPQFTGGQEVCFLPYSAAILIGVGRAVFLNCDIYPSSSFLEIFRLPYKPSSQMVGLLPDFSL